jgi:hypothetical protein
MFQLSTPDLHDGSDSKLKLSLKAKELSSTFLASCLLTLVSSPIRGHEFFTRDGTRRSTSIEQTVKGLLRPESAIESVTHLREVALEMLIAYSTMGTRDHRFCIGDETVRPGQESHGVFRIAQNGPVMNDSQLLGDLLVASPPV